MMPENYSALIMTLASEMAAAIALAEGGNVEGALPFRIHNPGDLELGDRGYGVEQAKTCYAQADPLAAITDETDGYSALRRECTAILIGASHAYSPSDTFEQIAARWTGGDNSGAWSRIVCGKLGVEPLDRLVDWVKARSEG